MGFFVVFAKINGKAPYTKIVTTNEISRTIKNKEGFS
jgi:hypothetical protein